jgi:hypothetical protein
MHGARQSDACTSPTILTSLSVVDLVGHAAVDGANTLDTGLAREHNIAQKGREGKESVDAKGSVRGPQSH